MSDAYQQGRDDAKSAVYFAATVTFMLAAWVGLAFIVIMGWGDAGLGLIGLGAIGAFACAMLGVIQ